METDVKTVVITGASGQLGSAITREILKMNMHAICISRKCICLHTSDAITPLSVGCDLATAEGAQHMAEVVERVASNRLSVVNCVGYFPGYRGSIELGYAEAVRVFMSNFVAVYFSSISLIPLLLTRGGGQFISFTSLSTEGAFPQMAAFDSAKAAVAQLTKQLANEFGGKGLHANAFALATLKTDEEMQLKPFGDHDRWIEPNEIAHTVAHFILTEPRLVNGNVIKCYNYSDSYHHMSYFDRIKT